MKEFLTPLRIFVVGNILLLITFPFFPTIGQQANTLAADTAGIAASFWGWGWLMSTGVVKWLVYLIFEGFILFATGMAFWKQKV
jgi:hypothetical protein